MFPLLMAALSLASEPAAPTDSDRVSLHAWGRAGYAVEIADDKVEHGPFLAMARLKARLDHEDRYGVYLHLAADGGELRLADAQVHATVTEGLRISAGRMKVPVSYDFMIPVEQMLLPTRALLDRLAPSRAIGLQARLTDTLPGGRTRARMRAGVFSPVDASFDGLAGAQVVWQGELRREQGLFVHAAGAVWLTGSDPARFGEASSPWDLRGDLAAGFEDDAWTVHLEGLVAKRLSAQSDAAAYDGGLTAMLGRRVEVESERHLVLEPVLALDLRSVAQEPMVRGTAAVNLHEDGWRLLQTLAYEIDHTRKDGVGHRVLVQIQAGL